ncbi:YT521-B-like domain-containing protein [Fimicolochytrium jonesii]|uniref:YT521-B-like domain-containing protein n=1 Tax=Fimicolochytrium jonesii TaxID=1396493 RepID=UPI0022FE23FD|nr:YT521-B-like domain-containing protein [Fimicolochytrium jonesii]KAI8822702.1 YT521-B-like domain-containing protein [Fimicolochytrium jonesii]
MESRPAQGYHAERPAQDDIWPSFVSPPTVEGIRRYSDAPRPSFAAQSRASPGTFNAGRGYGNYVDDSSFRESYGTNRYSFPSPSPGPPSASRQQHQRAVSLTALSEFHGNGIKNTLESPAWADTTPRPSGSSIVAARDRAAHSQQVQEQLLREYQEDAEWSEAATKFMESRPGDFAAGLSARQTDPGSVSGALFLRPVRPASMPTLPQLVNPSPAALVKPNPWAQQKVAEFVAARGLNPGPFVFDVRPRHARYFVIKSNSATNIVASVQHNVWSSTELGNRRLDNAFKANQAAAATAAASGAVESQPNSPVRGLGAHDHAVFLFFSVTSSGRFCGVARMTSAVDWNCTVTIWEQAKRWKGAFNVEWIFVKDVPNNAVRHLKVSANENKPVSNSRDTQELTEAIGHEMLRIYCEFHTQTSVLEELFTL